MSQLFAIHPDNPQARLLRKAVTIIEEGGLLVYPTDSGYAFGCQLGNRSALERIRKLRQLDKHHHLSLVARDLSKLGIYATISTATYRLLKAFTPGAYTFILNATPEITKLMLHPKKRTLGFRVPNHKIAQSLLEYLTTPLISTTLSLPNAQAPLTEPEAIKDILGNQVDLIIDGGNCSYEPTSVIDLTEKYPVVLRQGQGDIEPFI